MATVSMTSPSVGSSHGAVQGAALRSHYGATGNGRTKSHSAGLKIKKLGAEYEPSKDTCIKAFIRWVAEVAQAADDGADIAAPCT